MHPGSGGGGGGTGEVRSRRLVVASERVEETEDRLVYSSMEDEELLRKIHPIKDELGYLHWLGIVIVVACLYGSAIWLDRWTPRVMPATQFSNFSEERARITLNQLAGLGPRSSGSHALEVEAVGVITRKLDEIKAQMERSGVNRLEVDVQRPSGCYNLKFLASFTLCYHKITNVLARIGPKSGPSPHSILLNCHIDTLPDTPGATDDAAACAIMLDVMEVLAHSNETLENDIIFLFNGGEENFLQASHGFITKHPWRHTLRAFINLEGTGSGGREMLFQAGPGDSWLLKTYLDNAPHPHCSVVAQEVFQSGLIPSDTDFRIFRDWGRVSGLDIAYVRNGWVYHTEFDTPEAINDGALQRAGDNVLAVAKALIRSPYLKQAANFNEGNRWVFFDVVGIFTVHYSISTGQVMNYFVACCVFLLVWRRLSTGIYSVGELGAAFSHHFLCVVGMMITGIVLMVLVSAFGFTMSWYAMPELAFVIYVLPMINTAFWIHSVIAERKYKGLNAEIFHYDTVLLVWAAILVVLTYMGFATSFLFLIDALFPLLRDPLIYLMGRMGIVKVVTPRVVMYTQCVCLLPVMFFIGYAISLSYDFFVPVIGRLGNVINPEFVIMPLSLLTAWTFVMYTNNLIYVSRRLHFFIKCSMAVSLFGLLIVATTRVGWPYQYSEESPRLRRIIALHSKRSVYGFDRARNFTDTGLFVISLDYRGIKDLPDHTFLQGSSAPDCSKTPDEYCQLPYYTAIHELFPPSESRWVPVPTTPQLANPVSVQLVERTQPAPNQVKISLLIKGGSDKLTLHVTPLNGYELKEWSFTPLDLDDFGRRSTYFVFLTYGAEVVTERRIWILLEKNSTQVQHPDTAPSLEFVVATFHAHGPYQNSETITQLRSLINSRRKTPHAAVGYWRWGITMIGGVAELVAHLF